MAQDPFQYTYPNIVNSFQRIVLYVLKGDRNKSYKTYNLQVCQKILFVSLCVCVEFSAVFGSLCVCCALNLSLSRIKKPINCTRRREGISIDRHILYNCCASIYGERQLALLRICLQLCRSDSRQRIYGNTDDNCASRTTELNTPGAEPEEHTKYTSK